uniref:Uncharacterized protein n=1 Tax=Anguilla anguilla TaxID=7936 RepID=A0A0E9UKV0_ANGAN
MSCTLLQPKVTIKNVKNNK